jgi:hypothetical protein
VNIDELVSALPVAEVRSMHLEVPVLGLRRRWGFPKKAGKTYGNDRFKIFRIVAFDTNAYLKTLLSEHTISIFL